MGSIFLLPHQLSHLRKADSYRETVPGLLAFAIRMADSSDIFSADNSSLKLSMPGVASLVFLSTGDFVCLALSKYLEHLEIRDSLLTFEEAEVTKTVFAILGLLLSVLLGPIESFLRPDQLDKMGEKHIPFLLVQEIWKASLPWL